MSVLKSKRKESPFEVFHNLYKMRREVMDLTIRDFGYSSEKCRKRMDKRFGGRPYEELSDTEKANYDKTNQRLVAYDEWFIIQERGKVVDLLSEITREVFIANSIYPTLPEEYVERRLHQDLAIGKCYVLAQELQFTMETIPVNVNTLIPFTDSIQTEINLIKGWRKSDNRFRATSDKSSTNFANVNNNGNANNNNATNTNGVRPDFDSLIE